MRVGYARVSTSGQDLSGQVAELVAHGCDPKYIYQEVFTGAAASRPMWDVCLRSLRDGDTLVVTKLDRLGRSLKALVLIEEELRERGVGLNILDQGLDTSTRVGKMIFQMAGAFAEMELDLIRERTSHAMQQRPPGKRGGRPRALKPSDVVRIRQMKADGKLTMPEIARVMGVHQMTVRRALKASSEAPVPGME